MDLSKARGSGVSSADELLASDDFYLPSLITSQPQLPRFFSAKAVIGSAYDLWCRSDRLLRLGKNIEVGVKTLFNWRVTYVE